LSKYDVKTGLVVLAAAAVVAAGIFSVNSRVRGGNPQSDLSRPRLSRTETGEVVSAEGIEGQVVDAEGQPVGGAKVLAEREDGGARITFDVTDAEGKFRINVQGPGTYIVYGSKEEDGYPVTLSDFHKEVAAEAPTVYVADDDIARDVIIKFGPRASKLKGTIADAATNLPVTDAAITLRRADDPEIYYMIGASEAKTNGRFEVLVPPVPFTIEVSSADYETWAYSADGSGDHSDPLTVGKGKVRSLKIALRRKKPFKF
jgi:hypothetical protein